MHSPSSYQPAEALRAQSDAQIVSGYLAMIDRLPREKRLDALADAAAVAPGDIRKILLREFNNLSEKGKANV